MNTPSVVKSSPLWRPASRGIIVTLIAGLAILALGRGVNLPAREVYREMQTRQLEEDAQWVAQRLERRMNTPAPQREAAWPLAAMRAELHTLARQRHYRLLLAPDGGLPSLLMAYRWPVTIGLGMLFAGALLAVRQAAHARRKR